jgi:7-cyano-7-deazaguanine synthase
MKKKETAVVVLSGGQDSVTCLGVALAQFERVIAVGYDYGQRHKIELECAASVCLRHGVPYQVVPVPMLSKLVTSALTGGGDVSAPHAYKPGLPATFVPTRNALFLTLAHAIAQEAEATTIITGVCQTDFSGYPDCRDTFVKLLALALNEGYETDIAIRTPLMYLTKAETFALAVEADFLSEVIQGSHTCYNGDHTTFHEWGYGCGECPACKLRAAGWQRFNEGDFNPDLVAKALIG